MTTRFNPLRSLLQLLLTTAVLSACEEVIDVELPEEPPRLVVEGLLRVDRQEAFIPVRIQLRETNSFFESTPVTQAESILIQVDRFEGENLIETFVSSLAEERPDSGIYIPDPDATFDQRIPTIFLNEEVRFTLQIRHKGRQYVATTLYQPVVPINFIVQGQATLFEGDETEIIVSFTDPPNQKNFYLFQFDPGDYLTTEDRFYDGQLFQFSYFYEEPIEPGTEKEIRILGSSEAFHRYMDLLIEQSDLEGPFQPPVATVRGNITDVTEIDNRDRFDNADRPEVFPLGYFAVVQEYRETITIR